MATFKGCSESTSKIRGGCGVKNKKADDSKLDLTVDPIGWYCPVCKKEQFMNGVRADQKVEIYQLKKKLKALRAKLKEML